MASAIGWLHPEDSADQWDGFNDSGIEHFSGRPIWHLAREIIQNALDAKDSDLVEIKFKLKDVETATFPDIKGIKKNLKSCLDAAESESPKAVSFFQIALNELAKKKISVLEISDFHTKGMRGPSQNGTPFYAFMKAKGQSRKDSGTATGSFGIGKLAPYSVSKLRTIFISTVYQDEFGDFQQLTQGKSVLMSHDQDKKRKQGIGFWGLKDKCQPVIGISEHIPVWIQRVDELSKLSKNKGSTINVPCFDASKHWHEHLAVSVAENFFGAISAGKLRVDIDGKYVLDQITLKAFFDDAHIKQIIAPLKNEPDQFDNSKNYLAAVEDGAEVIVEQSEMLHLGNCQLRIILGEGLPKKLCVLRNGMFITDTLNRLKSFPDFKEFVAVLHCQSTKGNELLRAMEPPRHDDFEPDRLPTKDEQKKGATALRELAQWIRAMLKRHAKDPVSEITAIDELKDFFGDDESGESGKAAQEVNPYGDITIRAKPVKFKSRATSPTSNAATSMTEGQNGNEYGDYPGDTEENVGKGSSTTNGGDVNQGKDSGSTSSEGSPGKDTEGNVGGNGKNNGSGTAGGATRKPVEVNNIRAIVTSANSRKLFFTPVMSGKISLRMLEAGADVDYYVPVIATDIGSIEEGNILIDVIAGNRISLSIGLSQDFNGAIKVVANEV